MKTAFSFFLLIWSLHVPAQNLIENGDFEDILGCPTTLDELAFASGWLSYRGTPDLFNPCASFSIFTGIPKNIFGYQETYSDSTYTGLYAYDNNFFYREHIGRMLSAPLEVGK